MTGKKENRKPLGLVTLTRMYLDQVWVAVGFMTRLPVPYREAPLAQMVWAFPIAGAVVGLLSGLVLWAVLAIGLPPLAAALCALMTSAVVTGALHEDGLADCADGFWGGHTPERRLEIMRDSRSGAYGVLALVLVTGLKAALIADLTAYWGGLSIGLMLVAVHAMARSALPLALRRVPLAAKTGLAAMVGVPTDIMVAVALFIAMIVSGFSLIFVPLWLVPLMAVLVCLVALLMGALAKSKLGGLNGDTLGAMEQVSEIVCLVVLASIL